MANYFYLQSLCLRIRLLVDVINISAFGPDSAACKTWFHSTGAVIHCAHNSHVEFSKLVWANYYLPASRKHCTDHDLKRSHVYIISNKSSRTSHAQYGQMKHNGREKKTKRKHLCCCVPQFHCIVNVSYSILYGKICCTIFDIAFWRIDIIIIIIIDHGLHGVEVICSVVSTHMTHTHSHTQR
jgi:hypothetical protein